MILSDNDIKRFVSLDEIIIEPFNEGMVKPGSYTFTLNNRLWKIKEYDLVDTEDLQVEYDEIDMDEGGYILQPGEFILGQTKEQLSIANNVACFLDGRTSHVRIGLKVLQGSTFVEPGQESSHETLEISNISKSPIRLYPNMKIVKGIFVLLNHASDASYVDIGKYARQTEGKAVKDDQ